MALPAKRRRESRNATTLEVVLSRDILRSAERELWARAAGRCEFSGCNKRLYKSSITQERVNVGERAHIHSFSAAGPRGRGGKKTKTEVNDIANLLLVCHECHRSIDQNKEDLKYSADLLQRWKREHEQRIELVTGINASKRSHVVLYGARIGEETSKLQFRATAPSLFPGWYPAEERPIELSMTSEAKDDSDHYWSIEDRNLIERYERLVESVLESGEATHLSVFALAPMPLLMRLGSLLTDKRAIEVYQLHREPQTWSWLSETEKVSFEIQAPTSFKRHPAVVISLSDSIAPDRVTEAIGTDVSIWQITIDRPHNDFLRTREQLAAFRSVVRSMLVEIGQRHGKPTPISFFPAMPLACAVELGRVRMPKADPTWIVYDQSNKRGRFIRAITIGN